MITAIVMIVIGLLCLIYNGLSYANYRNHAFLKLEGIRYDKFSVILKSFLGFTTVVAMLFTIGGILLVAGLMYGKLVAYAAMASLMIYIIGLMIFGRHTIWKSEMASAMGVGNGWIMPAVISLIPIWGPFAV